jgi:sporadic carbohydrate cluster protein (TIGR04323 family)
VTHHEFGGMRIPVTVQNLVLRDYAARMNKVFKLSFNEYAFKNCFVQLSGLLQTLPSLEGIVMCSLFMLPNEKDKRLEVYRAVINNNAALHLIFESLIITSWQDAERAEELFLLDQAIRKAPKELPRELLPDLKGADFFS